MKILFISIGKSHDAAIADGIAEFSARIERYAPLEWRLLANGKNEKEEADAILRVIDEKDYVVVLDERGKELSSPELAQVLEKRLNESSKRLVVVIGGAYGIHDSVKERANFTWSLSKLVFPHQIVRLVLAEQIYRAFTILKGEKYHHQ